MSRAIVLGGGGPVGIGWEAGLLVGLGRRGVDPAVADLVVGTSAGSVVGYTLASGGELSQATDLVNAANTSLPAAGGPGAEAGGGIEALMATVAEAANDREHADRARAKLGRIAVDSATIPEDLWLQMFAIFAEAEWPDHFRCTAVSAADGSFRIWDGSTGVPVQLAIASSCAVPGIFPPVTIQGTPWMDGGVRDMLNTDVAAGHDRVLAVSCTLLELPAGLGDPVLDAVFASTRMYMDQLRSSGSQVEVIVPGDEMLEISGWGMNLMDFSRAAAAYEAGVRQGEVEAGRLTEFWAG
jgi:NTE family protein